MRSLPFLLLAGIALVLMAGDAEAKEPEWNYTTGSGTNSVDISADGEYIAAGSDDGKVYLFNKDSSTPIWSYTAGDGVLSVAISGDGEYIAAGSLDSNVYLFSKDSSTPLWSSSTGNRVWSVAISADGEYITAGSWDNKVYLFNKDSSTPLWSSSTGNFVLSVDISADGQMIAAGSDKVYLFAQNSSTPLWSYDTGDSVRAVDISADKEYLAAGSWNSEVYLFAQNSSTPLWNYATGDSVYSVAIADDGEYVVAGSKDYNAYFFSKHSGTPLWNYTTGDTVASLDVSANGEEIVIGSDKVYLFNKDSNTPLWSYTPDDSLRAVAISSGAEYITAGSWDNDDQVYLFDKDIPPTAHIDSIEPTTIRFDEDVALSGSGSGVDASIIAYQWTSSIDGLLGDEEDLSITGLSAGDHIISFRVQDDNGEWSEWDTAELTVIPNTPPVATIDSITPSSVRFDAEVTFSGSGSDSDGTVIGYEWNSSLDGILSNAEDFSTTGLSAGTHAISFRVQDNDGGWSGRDTGTLVIDPNTLPVAMIDSISPSPAGEGTTILFNGSGTDSDGTVIGYEWNSSLDGFLSDEKNFDASDFSPGTHTISFRMQDNDGEWSGWDTATLVINPNTLPVGTIVSITPSPVEGGSFASFTGTGSDSDGSIIAYRWISSIDGDLSTEKDFISKLSLGDHILTFQVQDNAGGWSVEDSRTLLVGTAPVPNAGQDIEVEPNTDVQFVGSGYDTDGEITLYEWDIDGDGEYDWSSDSHGITTYSYNRGTYTAVLRLTDNDGFTSTDSITITVRRAEVDEEDDLPGPSVISVIIAVAVIALRRRY